jgi:sugar (pentulose or hexulose) kinase
VRIPLARPDVIEATALGAAALAGLVGAGEGPFVAERGEV